MDGQLKALQKDTAKKAIKLFALSFILIVVLWYKMLYVEQFDFSAIAIDMDKVANKITEKAHRKVLVDTSRLRHSSKQAANTAFREIAAHSGTVFLDTAGFECSKECPIHLKFVYDEDQKDPIKVNVKESTHAITFSLRDDRSFPKSFKELSSQLLEGLGGLIDTESIEYSK